MNFFRGVVFIIPFACFVYIPDFLYIYLPTLALPCSTNWPWSMTIPAASRIGYHKRAGSRECSQLAPWRWIKDTIFRTQTNHPQTIHYNTCIIYAYYIYAYMHSRSAWTYEGIQCQVSFKFKLTHRFSVRLDTVPVYLNNNNNNNMLL